MLKKLIPQRLERVREDGGGAAMGCGRKNLKVKFARAHGLFAVVGTANEPPQRGGPTTTAVV